MKVSAGNKGDAVRSDCYVEISDNEGPGNKVLLKSKVQALYGKSIENLCLDILHFFGLNDVLVEVEDSGALPFVISARMEAAIKQFVHTEKMYLPEFLFENNYHIHSGRFRRTRLYIPGNNPKMMINAGIYGSDAIILDLEDSVHPSKKAEAAILVRNALCRVNFYGAEKMVRINQIPRGLKDLDFVVPFGVHTIVIPKCETSDDVVMVDQYIEKITGKAGSVHLIPIVESALGVENACEIATGSKNTVAMAIGLEDYTADIGAQRTEAGNESFFARSRVVNAARAARIQPLYSVFSGFEDIEALTRATQKAKALGFEGLGCIHPGQIKTVNDGFSPSENEIGKAKQIVYAYHQAAKDGVGVVAVDSKMVDAPVVKRALKTIENAIAFGILNKNWQENYANGLD